MLVEDGDNEKQKRTMAIGANTFGWSDLGWGEDGQEKQRWLLAGSLAALAYVALGVALYRLSTQPPEVAPKPSAPIEVTFRQEVVPPPPVEPQAPAPPAPPAAAPVVPKHLKVRKVDQPRPPKPLVAPKEISQAPPKEADPSEDRGVAVAGDPALGGDPAGLEGGVAGARPQAEPIALPEDAEPPVPLPSNPLPDYPAQAKAEGRTGLVVLKVVIGVDGRVQSAEVLRGDEPFASAALQAVRQWRYQPARYKEQPIRVYRIIQIPFKLKA